MKGVFEEFLSICFALGTNTHQSLRHKDRCHPPLPKTVKVFAMISSDKSPEIMRKGRDSYC